MSNNEVRVNIASEIELHDNEDELVTLPSQEQADDQSIGQVDFMSFCGFIYENDWEGADKILKEEYLTARISDIEFDFAKGDTVLHIAVRVGANRSLRGLVNLMRIEDLTIKNHDGNTAFFIAAATGRVAFAKVMFNRNNRLPNIRGENEMLPIYEAAQKGHKEMVKLLYRVAGFKLTEDERIELLHILIEKSGLYGPGSNRLPQEERLPPLEQLVEHLLGEVKSDILRILDFVIEKETADFFCLIIYFLPNLISGVHGDACDEILRNVILKRRKDIFFQIKKAHAVPFISALVQYQDSEGNNLLHLAAKLASSDELGKVSGVALQLQHELLWFKAVEKFVNPWDAKALNHKGQTPKALFNEEHKTLRENGEKWMKDTANSCMIVAALIATVVFAAAFTIPGGTKEASGTPHVLHEVSFKIFIISDAISLILSVCSILAFLSILTSRYAEKDFLLVLPRKLVVGLLTLLLSIATMMVVFCATIFIVFRDGMIWAPILVSVIAFIPVISFTALQWRLLLDAVGATFEASHHHFDDNDVEFGYHMHRRWTFRRSYYKQFQDFYKKHFQEVFSYLR